MQWITNTIERVKSLARIEPLECPRGWGQVAFVASVWCVPPLLGVDRKCPIADVGGCSSCTYASNPDAFRLSEQLAELDRLREEGLLSSKEYAVRRAGIVRLHDVPGPPGRGFLITAWLLGPLGVLFVVAGILLVVNVHPAFWGLAGGGAIAAVLALSFWALARSARSSEDVDARS